MNGLGARLKQSRRLLTTVGLDRSVSRIPAEEEKIRTVHEYRIVTMQNEVASLGRDLRCQ